MDPASIVGILASSASLVVLSGKLALDIHNILSKYSNVPNKLEDLKNDCLVLELGFKRVNTWLKQNQPHADIGDNGLSKCLDVFDKALVALDADISKAVSKGSATGFQLSAKKKMKFLWNEQTMNEHAERVRHTRSNLHFLLAAFQLPENDSNRQIRQVARAATIRYTRDSDAASVRSKRTVDFNQVLANTEIYRQVGLGSEPARGGRSLSSSFSAGTTLLATQDYHNSAGGHLEFREGDLIKVLRTSGSSFWLGEFEGKTGRFSIECCDMTIGLKDEALELESDSGESSISRTIPSHRPISDSQFQSPPATKNMESASSNQSLALSQDKQFDAVIQKMKNNTYYDITAKDSKGWTALHHCVHRGEIRVVEKLLWHGAEVNAESNDNVTPLALAIDYPGEEYVKMVRLLLKSGASVWMVPSPDSTFLHQQVASNRWETASILIEHGLRIDTKDSLQRTPLYEAASLGRKEFVANLARSGADLNACDGDGMTALHVAAGREFADIVQILKDSGANLDARDVKRQSALHIAANRGNIKVVDILLAGIGVTGLEVRDSFGASPIHHAAAAGHAHLLRALALQYGPSPLQKKIWNLRTDDGRMPLHIAASQAQVAAGAALIQDGADMRAYTFLPFSPLQCAAQHGHAKFAALLIRQGGKGLIHEKYQSPLDTFLVKIAPIAGPLLIAISFYVPVLAALAALVSAITNLSIGSLCTSVLLLFCTVGLDVVLLRNNMSWGSTRTERRRMIWRIKTNADFTELCLSIFLFSLPSNIALSAALTAFDFHVVATCHFYASLLCLGGILLGSLEYLGSLVGLWKVTRDMLPLHLAIRNKHEAVVRLLIDNGADLEARDDNYDTALEAAWPSTNGIGKILTDAGAQMYIYSYF